MTIKIDEKKYYWIKELQKLIWKSFEKIKYAIVTGKLKATIVEPQVNKYYKSKNKYVRYSIKWQDVIDWMNNEENWINLLEEIQDLKQQMQFILDYLEINPIENEPNTKRESIDVPKQQICKHKN